MFDNYSPENTISSIDPGDYTFRRYRFQAGCAAIYALALLDPDSEFQEIFCEHHEDILIKKKDGKFIGIQIKTRKANLQQFKSNDKEILMSIGKFVVDYLKYPDYFIRFIIATNHSFYSSPDFSDLRNIIDSAKKCKSTPQNEYENKLKIYIHKIKNLSILKKNKDDNIDQKICKVLSITIIDESLPKLDDLEIRLISNISLFVKSVEATMIELKEISEKLLLQSFKAASLSIESSKSNYFTLMENPEIEKSIAIINGKRIKKDDIQSLLSELGGSGGRLHLPENIDILKLPKGTTKLEYKMTNGGISFEAISQMKDYKYSTEYLYTQWISKYGAQEANSRATQINSIVQNECLEAKEEVEIEGSLYGQKMLIDVRKRLRERQKESNDFYGCKYEHLLGASSIVTEQCKIWWSEKFELPNKESE